MHKATIIITGLILLCFVGTCVYFVGGVSATFPPIKKYVYHGGFNQLEKVLEKYSKLDSSFRFKKDTGFNEIDIDMKRLGANITYGLICKNLDDDTTVTEIDLVMAFDTTNKIGGYGIKADGMKDLLNYFDNNIIARLRKDEHAVIGVKKEGFFERINIY